MPANLERSNPAGLAWAALRRNEPGRFAFALRLTLACCITALIGQWFEIPEPALAVYLVLFVNRPVRTTSILLAALMLAFVSLLIALLIPLAALLVDDPFQRLLAMACLSFGTIFLGSASRLRPFASTIALVTAYMLDLLGSVPAGELAVRGLLYAWLFVAIPAGVSVVVALLLAPSPSEKAGSILAHALWLTADLLDAPEAGMRDRLLSARREVALGIPPLLKLAQIEATLQASDANQFRAASTMTIRMLAAIELLDRHQNVSGVAAIATAVTPTLRGMAKIFAAGAYPTAIEQPLWPVGMPNDLTFVIGIISEALAEFETSPQPPIGGPTRTSGFFTPDAFTNPVYLQHALKVTLAAMTCYLLYSLWDWPGIHSAMIRLADLTADFAAARLGPAHSATKSVVSVSLDGG